MKRVFWSKCNTCPFFLFLTRLVLLEYSYVDGVLSTAFESWCTSLLSKGLFVAIAAWMPSSWFFFFFNIFCSCLWLMAPYICAWKAAISSFLCYFSSATICLLVLICHNCYVHVCFTVCQNYNTVVFVKHWETLLCTLHRHTVLHT